MFHISVANMLLGNKNSDNWDLISEGSAKHTVVLEGSDVKSDYEKIMKCNDDTCKKFKKEFEELSKPYAAETGDDRHTTYNFNQNYTGSRC